MNETKMTFGQIIQVDPREVKTAGFNPAMRTSAHRLGTLKQSIAQHGVLEPIKISRDGVLGDGHCRVACARALGLSQVPAIFYDLSAEELFNLNNTSRAVSNTEWLAAYVNGLKNLPRAKAAMVERLRALVGADGLEKLVQLKISPRILVLARYVARYCVAEDDDDFVRLTLWWLVDLHQQFMVRRAMADHVDASIIETAILENRPLSQHWGVR